MTQSAGTAPRRRSGLLWSRSVLIALLLLAVSATVGWSTGGAESGNAGDAPDGGLEIW